MGDDAEQRRVFCAMCGTATAGPPRTWTMQVGRHGAEWVCDECTRRHLRSIEGRLERDWW